METAAELVMEKAKAKTAKAEPAATSKPLSAAFCEHCFNVGLLVICAHYIFTVYVITKSCGKWQSLGLIAYVTPVAGGLLYLVLNLKGKHTEKYAMAHLDNQVAVKAPAAGNV